jgi:hypothetical protein
LVFWKVGKSGGSDRGVDVIAARQDGAKPSVFCDAQTRFKVGKGMTSRHVQDEGEACRKLPTNANFELKIE